jgi:branched-chain amino acid transport system permease protein
MFYRETGQFKTSYEADSAIFPILQDRIGIAVMLVIAFIAVPVLGNDFFINTMMIPFLIFALAAIGLNILTGYTGQISLGSGGFMGVGAYSCYKLATFFPDVNLIILVVVSGVFAAGIGMIFGLPSLRIKGFYLVVTTLAAQFFLTWAFIRIAWLYNYNDSGAIDTLPRKAFGYWISGPDASSTTRYLVVLCIVIAMTWFASNLVRGRIGRSWMMIRDMDIAAELMGVRPLYAKLSAFAVSSFYCGVAGAMMVFFWLGSAEVESFDENQSFLILFMVILGGLGSIMGSYMGAAFMVVLPVLLRATPEFLGIPVNPTNMEHYTIMIVGALIIFFLIVEPHGLARLWQIGKEKLRTWPFPYA